RSILVERAHAFSGLVDLNFCDLTLWARMVNVRYHDGAIGPIKVSVGIKPPQQCLSCMKFSGEQFGRTAVREVLERCHGLQFMWYSFGKWSRDVLCGDAILE